MPLDEPVERRSPWFLFAHVWFHCLWVKWYFRFHGGFATHGFVKGLESLGDEVLFFSWNIFYIAHHVAQGLKLRHHIGMRCDDGWLQHPGQINGVSVVLHHLVREAAGALALDHDIEGAG